MKKHRIVITILCCILILGFLGIIRYTNIPTEFANWVAQYISKNRELPDDGLYLCTDCDVYIQFYNGSPKFIYPDGQEESAHVDYGNNLFGVNSDLQASIFWEQDKNIILLEIKQKNEFLTKNSKHIFTWQKENSVVP